MPSHYTHYKSDALKKQTNFKFRTVNCERSRQIPRVLARATPPQSRTEVGAQLFKGGAAFGAKADWGGVRGV